MAVERVQRDATAREPDRLYSSFDRAVEDTLERWFVRHRRASVAVSILVYAGLSFTLGPALGVSTNYIVLVPVIATALAYGLRGGVVIGLVALPANLAIFALLGHPEYAPASKAIAELSGILVGTTLGYLSDYHRKLNTERSLRKDIETELRAALLDKEALFREVHHRVKNNLNLIKSIIGLQARRSDDTEFREAAALLTGRIMSISFVHERLCRTAELSSVALDEHIADLVAAIAMSVGNSRHDVRTQLDLEPMSVPMDLAVPLGLIVNEVVTNTLRHARTAGEPLTIALSLKRTDERIELTASDNGSGFAALEEGSRVSVEALAPRSPGSLGLTLLDLMCSQLSGDGSYARVDGLTVFSVSVPLARRGAA